MFLTTHAAAGLAISKYVDSPTAVLLLSFASHFVLDFIPHGDEHLYRDQEWRERKQYRWVLMINCIDVVALLVLVALIANSPELPGGRPMLFGIIGGILPDFLSYLFPTIHQRFSWLWLIRWLYAATKPTGLRYVVRAQDWLHQVLHHEIFRRDVPLPVGISMQVILIALVLVLFR